MHNGHSSSQGCLPDIEGISLSVCKEKIDITENNSLYSKDPEIYNLPSTENCPGQTQPGSNRTFALPRCLFCNLDSPTLDTNLDHMDRVHGLFIPDQGYLNDIGSLLGYLYNIISDFQTCLYCGSPKGTVEATQQHMRDKGHCMLNLDKSSEFEPFYDYSGSGSDEDTVEYDGEESSPHVKYGNADNQHNDTLANSATSLHLPSGKTSAHRSQLHHHRHRQNLQNSARTAQYAITNTSPNFLTTPPPRQSRTLAPRPNAAKGMLGVPESRQRALRAVEKQMLKLETRARNQYRWGVERSANRQKHFKVSVLLESGVCELELMMCSLMFRDR